MNGKASDWAGVKKDRSSYGDPFLFPLGYAP